MLFRVTVPAAVNSGDLMVVEADGLVRCFCLFVPLALILLQERHTRTG